MRGHLVDVASAIVAVFAGVLPARYWPVLDALPIRRMALISALATLGTGFAVGINGFFEHTTRVMQASGKLQIAIAEKQLTGELPLTAEVAAGPMAVAMLAPFAFVFLTPLGQLSAYLVVAGSLRALACAVDAPFGDPLLTGADHLIDRFSGRIRDRHRRSVRTRQEGRQVPDRLYPGEWAGLADFEFVVVASRHKPEWDAGALVLTPDKWYKLGAPFEVQSPEGLRTIYPLSANTTGEVLRRGVQYQLPPLQRRRTSWISNAASRAIAPPRSSPPDTAKRFRS